MSKTTDPRMLADDTKGDIFGGKSNDAEPEKLSSCPGGKGEQVRSNQESPVDDRPPSDRSNDTRRQEDKQKGSGQGIPELQSEQKPRSDSSRGRSASDRTSKMTSGPAPEIIQLPQTFIVKYLGESEARGLWGIKYTRRPVDVLVSQAKSKPNVPLPLIRLDVSTEGINASGYKTKDSPLNQEFTIDSISYGVQDLVYTRVFAMIVVSESSNVFEHHPFRCFAFVCENRGTARKLTLALAKAFQEFSQSLKNSAEALGEKTDMSKLRPKRFAIDLRSADELQKDIAPEEDSEA